MKEVEFDRIVIADDEEKNGTMIQFQKHGLAVATVVHPGVRCMTGEITISNLKGSYQLDDQEPEDAPQRG